MLQEKSQVQSLIKDDNKKKQVRAELLANTFVLLAQQHEHTAGKLNSIYLT